MKAFHYSSLPSTNDEAMKLAHQPDVPEFSYIIADEQTNGRGRNGNSWSSALGAGLYMSMILRPKMPAEYLPQLTLVAGVALCEALETLPHVAESCIGIKWPNDILMNSCKVAGILCEADFQGSDVSVIVGIGINISTTKEQLPSRVIYPATSLAIEGIEVDPATLADRVAQALQSRFERFYEEKEIASTWMQYDVLKGTTITVETPDVGLVEGIASGITPAGELIIIDPATNESRIITAGSIVSGNKCV